MIKNYLISSKGVKLVALSLLSLFFMKPGAVFASLEQPSETTLKPTAVVETREILERASHIALQGIEAVQQVQGSTSSNTTEMLKNYMASMVYVPRRTKLPSDIEALDEPWAGSGDNADGLVVPHLDDNSGLSDDKEPDIHIPVPSAKKFFKFLNPVQNAFISSGFGFRWGRPHQGVDLAVPMGAPIVSAEAGKVVYSGWMNGYGNFIAIEHGHGLMTHYAHCSSLLVHTGQMLKKGQLIGRVGSTGNSTGPHLHFEVLANGVHRNPIHYLHQSLPKVSVHDGTR